MVDRLSTPPGGTLRADAARNRDQIVDAARRLYAEGGLGISMGLVAKVAGVGKATLFRRFSSKDELVAAVFTESMTGYLEAAEYALSYDDPWRGFTEYVTKVCAMQAENRGFADVLTLSFPHAPQLEDIRRRAHDALLRLVARAKTDGNLRHDFTSEDIFILLLANAGVVGSLGGLTSRASDRFAGQMIRAFAVPGAPLPRLPDGPSSAEIESAIARDRPAGIAF